MRRRLALILAVPALAAAAFLLSACDDNKAVAQTDWKITVFANPADIDLVTNPEGRVTLSALLVDKSGLPQTGIGIRFATSSGSLESGGGLRTTNAEGVATDVLFTTVDASVTATSGTITSTAVAIAILDVNRPEAVIAITPSVQARSGSTVVFSGTDSTSPDPAATIVDAQWEIYSTNPDPDVDYVFDSPNNAPVSKIFTNEQTFSAVRLRVQDDRGRWSEWASEANYNIFKNLAPKADVTPATVTVTGSNSSGSYTCFVELSAAASIDSDGSIVRYDWSWGDGQIDYILTGVTQQGHTYRAPRDSITPYAVVLTVWDNGDGTCPPMTSTGGNNCASRKSATDTAQVVCLPAP